MSYKRNALVRAWRKHNPNAPDGSWDEREQWALSWAASVPDDVLLQENGLGRATVAWVRSRSSSRVGDRLQRLAKGDFG